MVFVVASEWEDIKRVLEASCGCSVGIHHPGRLKVNGAGAEWVDTCLLVATAWIVLFLLCESVCLSLCGIMVENVVWETPTLDGPTPKMV